MTNAGLRFSMGQVDYSRFVAVSAHGGPAVTPSLSHECDSVLCSFLLSFLCSGFSRILFRFRFGSCFYLLRCVLFLVTFSSVRIRSNPVSILNRATAVCPPILLIIWWVAGHRGAVQGAGCRHQQCVDAVWLARQSRAVCIIQPENAWFHSRPMIR